MHIDQFYIIFDNLRNNLDPVKQSAAGAEGRLTRLSQALKQ